MASKKKASKKAKSAAKKASPKKAKTKKTAVKAAPKKSASKKPAPQKSSAKKTAPVKPAAKSKTAPKPKTPAKKPAVKISGAKGSLTRALSEIKAEVPEAYATCLLSGGLVSSVMAVLGHKALGDRCKIFIADTGLMRENESKETFLAFKKMGIPVQIINMRKEFTSALKDKKDPAGKKQALLKALYCDTLNTAVKTGRTRHFLHCDCADKEALIGPDALNSLYKEAGVNVQAPYNQKIVSPLAGLTRAQIVKLARDCKLPSSIINAAPFALSGLAGRVVGEATTEKIEIIRRVTVQIDAITGKSKTAVIPVLADGLVPMVQGNKTTEGFQIEIRAWENSSAKIRKPAKLVPKVLDTVIKKICGVTPGVAGISLNITPLPPACTDTV